MLFGSTVINVKKMTYPYNCFSKHFISKHINRQLTSITTDSRGHLLIFIWGTQIGRQDPLLPEAVYLSTSMNKTGMNKTGNKNKNDMWLIVFLLLIIF
jgi:hypothetical protein